jgi:hypothetical protein
MNEVAAFVAWLGAAIIVLADSRRGLAAGLAVLAAAAGAIAWSQGEQGGAIVLLAGGVLGSALRFTIGPDGWGLMQPGSTPRLLFTVIVALVALWVALAATSGAGAGFRFAVVTVLVLLGGRLLEAAEPAVMLTSIAGVALVLGIVSGDGIVSYAVAALVTAGVSAMPMPATPRPRGT